MKSNVVTRFAPSPTGLLHGGNYRTAVFAYLFSKKMGGKFIVRIEDTDRERSKKEYEENILETLAWLNLKHDQLYRQSDHQARHTEELKRLIANGHAYISKEDIEATPPKADESPQRQRRAEVIRFANPKTTVTFTDVIRGPITFDTTELGDFIIARSETEPVFHFAVVVDDHDEGVTHVIRGEDHISNTARQILIQKALGYEMPVYAHLPLVLGPDRTKLSKRKGAKALTEYRAEGYLPEAIINYLALLGWHPEGEKEIFSVAELVQEFNITRTQKGAGIFDETKLLWVNHEHLRRLSDASYAQKLKDFIKKDFNRELVPLLKDRAQTLKEAAEALENEFNFIESVSFDQGLLIRGAKTGAPEVKKHLTTLATLLKDTDGDFTAEKVKDAVFPYATQQGRAAVLWPMRIALSGKEKSPDPFTLAALLGRQRTLERIEKAAHML
jgi:glutamyl-tRNA synthetase